MSNEYISKADAIDILDDFQAEIENGEGNYSWAKFKMNELELADVVPVVHGKWIDHDGNKVQLNEHGETCGTCFCSRCGEWLVASDEYAVKGYFCPNCGAKMEE